ncbi:MAG: hypothetical protein NC248_10145 [Bacteroides sp.]|nr:hypothetical protein [Bacteroides sp.]MCM1390473.1 hypothetical protein [Bacteroides sp.]
MVVDRRGILLILTSLWAVMLPATMLPVVNYATDRLERIASMLRIGAAVERGETDFTHNGNQVRVVRNNDVVTHIGYSLFVNNERELFDFPVFDFLERSALEADLPGILKDVTVERSLEEDGVRYANGDLRSLLTVAPDKTLSLAIENPDGRNYLLRWTDAAGNVAYAVTFPIFYDLLHGTEMKENERRLWEGLSRHSIVHRDTLQVDASMLIESPDSAVLVLEGDQYYFPENNSNRYYESVDSATFKLVCSADHPLYSLANLVTSTEIVNNYKVRVRLVGYDYSDKYFTMPLSEFVDYFISKGCKPYFGVIEADDKKITALLSMKNEKEGYCHNIRLTAPSSIINIENGEITARITPYIPISRILSLFDD